MPSGSCPTRKSTAQNAAPSGCRYFSRIFRASTFTCTSYARLRSLDEASADDVLWCDGLAVGSPTNMGLLSWKMKRFWDDTMRPHWMRIDGKIACAFSSAGGWGGGMELACQSLLTVLMNFGFLVFGVTDYASKTLTLHYGAVVAKEPRGDADEAACRLLGQRLAEWVATYIHGKREQHPQMKLALRVRP